MLVVLLFQALFIDALRWLFRIKSTPSEQRIMQERAARSEALYASIGDLETEMYQGIHRTFIHHHDQARARHGL